MDVTKLKRGPHVKATAQIGFKCTPSAKAALQEYCRREEIPTISTLMLALVTEQLTKHAPDLAGPWLQSKDWVPESHMPSDPTRDD